MKKENIGKNISILTTLIALLVSGCFSIVWILKNIKFYLVNGYINLKSFLDIIGHTEYIGLNDILNIIPAILILFFMLFLSFISLLSLFSTEKITTEEAVEHIGAAFWLTIISFMINSVL